MKSVKIFLSAVALFSVLAACQKPVPEPDPNIVLDQKELSFTQAAGSQTVTFLSTRDWAVKNLPDWVAAEPERGKASDSKQTVTIKVLENTGKDRNCSITFSIGLVKEYLTIKQAGPGGEDKPGDGTLDNPYKASEAVAVAKALDSGAETANKVYVKGFVKEFNTSKHEDGIKNYGNALFYITDDNTYKGDAFYCYQVYYLGGKKFTSVDQIKVGDEVIIYGKLTNYNGTAETVGKGAAYIYSLNGKTEGGGDEPDPGPIDPITGTNLVSNGSFETWTGDKPEGWDFTSGNAELKKSSDSKEGTVSCEILGVADANKRLMSKPYTLKAGTYQIQAYVKGEGQYRVGYAKLTNGKVADTQNDYIYIDVDPVQATSGWEQHIVQFTLTDQTQVSVNFMNNKKGNGKSILVDDVKLVTKDGGVIEGDDPGPASVVDATVAQVISEKKTDVIYRLKGTVSKFNSQYCSFDITDNTGSIYVYSVTSETKSEYKDKLKDGDTVTIEGEYQFYASKNQDEIVNAKITEWKSAGGEGGEEGDDDTPDPSTLTQITCKEFNALPKDDDGWYILEGEVQSITQATYGNLYIKDASGETAYIYGVKTATGESQKFNTLGVEIGDVLKIYGQHAIYVDSNNAETVEMKNAVYISHTKGADQEVNSILTLTFPDDNSAANKVNGYDDPWVAKTGNYSFDMVAFNNYEWKNWTYIRCGRKKESVASITTSNAIDDKVGSIIVTFDSIEKSDVNSIKLYVSANKDFNSVDETVSVTPDLGNVEFGIKAPAAGKYYKLEFDCKASSKNKNGFVQISKIVFVAAE